MEGWVWPMPSMLFFSFHEPESFTDSHNIIIFVSCSDVLVAEFRLFRRDTKKKKTTKDVTTTTTEDVWMPCTAKSLKR